MNVGNINIRTRTHKHPQCLFLVVRVVFMFFRFLFFSLSSSRRRRESIWAASSQLFQEELYSCYLPTHRRRLLSSSSSAQLGEIFNERHLFGPGISSPLSRLEWVNFLMKYSFGIMQNLWGTIFFASSNFSTSCSKNFVFWRFFQRRSVEQMTWLFSAHITGNEDEGGMETINLLENSARKLQAKSFQMKIFIARTF